MDVKPNPLLVSDYLSILPTIRINREYQRSSGIWPARAKSALIETMILGYPMPAMYLHQRYDPEAKTPFKELVDGQQRTETINEFANEKLTLSKTLRTERLRGKKLSSLGEEDFAAFMSYSLPLFIFAGATVSDVREAFRRLNSFTVVLNAEEKRHSTYNGPFKWFVHSLSAEVSDYFARWGTLTPVEINRMKDSGLVTEIIYAFLKGIRTTKSSQLDALYREFDEKEEFHAEADISERVVKAVLTIDKWDWFLPGPLSRAYQITFLILAVMHSQRAVETLSSAATGGMGLRDEGEISRTLALLRDSLESFPPDEGDGGDDDSGGEGGESHGENAESAGDLRFSPYMEFVQASRQGTNTAKARLIRFQTFMSAVSRVDNDRSEEGA